MARYQKRAFTRHALALALVFALTAGAGTISLAAGPARGGVPTRQVATTPLESTGAIVLPGSFEAEDYRAGGEGIGFHDTTQENIGGAYRADAVDIQAGWGADNSYHVAWIDAGEWLAYNVEFDASGQYVFSARVATTDTCHGSQALHVELDGADVSGIMKVPNTGGWQQWEDVTSRPVSVNAGSYTLRIVAASNGFNLDRIEVRKALPEPNTLITLPGHFEAEDYRPGGEDVGYHDTTQGNVCGVYRSDDVDIAVCDRDGDTRCYYVGWIREGEWLAYDVSVPDDGAYIFTIRAATIRDDRSFYLELDGERLSGSIPVPNTGDWHVWTAVVTEPLEIPAGTYALKIVAETGRFNLNDIEVSASPAAVQ
ncbi:hypothetical protein BH23CHL1_BH23CHL1_04630 [soil metagenome]